MGEGSVGFSSLEESGDEAGWIVGGFVPELVQAVAAVFELEAEGLTVGGFIELSAGAVVEGGTDEVVEFVTYNGPVAEVSALGIGGFEVGWDGFAEGEKEG